MSIKPLDTATQSIPRRALSVVSSLALKWYGLKVSQNTTPRKLMTKTRQTSQATITGGCGRLCSLVSEARNRNHTSLSSLHMQSKYASFRVFFVRNVLTCKPSYLASGRTSLVQHRNNQPSLIFRPGPLVLRWMLSAMVKEIPRSVSFCKLIINGYPAQLPLITSSVL